MREDQHTCLMICRIITLLYVPVSVACAVSFFFTANLRSCVLSLLTIPLILLPDILERLLHWKKPFPLALLYLGTLLLGISGNAVFRLGRWIPFYDPFCHAVEGVFFVLVGVALLCMRYPALRRRELAGLSCGFGFLFSVCIGLLAMLFELLPFLSPLTTAPDAVHIVIDLCVILLSAGIFSILLYRFPESKILSFPILAVTVFVRRNAAQTPSGSITITSVQEASAATEGLR